MKIDYKGTLYIKAYGKYVPLTQSVDFFENLEKENDRLKQENEQLKEKNKILEAKNFEKCPFRYSDMGCDYCDWKDRDLKEEYENELQEEAQQHEQRMFDLQCQNYDFDYGDVKQ